MTIKPATQTRRLTWQDDLKHLLTRPIVMRQGTYREGKMLGVHVSPRPRQGQETMDVYVALFPLRLSPPTADEVEADQAALAAFLQGLQSPATHVRVAACEALGQLGHAAARQALRAACEDEHHDVRTAAVQALTALDTPRIQESDLRGVRLQLWEQVHHLWKPLDDQATNQRGQVRFTKVPAAAICRLQLLGIQPQGQFTLAAQPASRLAGQERATRLAGQELAARSAVEHSSRSLLQSQTLSLADGDLLCTLAGDNQGQVVLEFRSDAPQLQGGWIGVTAASQQQADTVRHFVPLEAKARGMLVGRCILSEILDLAQGYEITFEPMPAPPGEV